MAIIHHPRRPTEGVAHETAAPTAGPTSEVAPGAGKKGKKGKKNRTEEVVPPEPVLAEPTERTPWHVLADPEGNELCAFPSSGDG